MTKNIGFVSTRFAGTDGVSLESSKWANVFEQNGYRCFWFGGEVDRDPEKAVLVPEAHFKHELVQWINTRVYGNKGRAQRVTCAIHDLRSLLKSRLHDFINEFEIDLIIAENTLTIPLHVSLGLALTETIAETQLPTIAHHHDFYWEKELSLPLRRKTKPTTICILITRRLCANTMTAAIARYGIRPFGDQPCPL